MQELGVLISTLCPDGVEYKPLSEIAEISRGGGLQKKDFCEEGFPCIHYGQIYTQFEMVTDHAITYVPKDVFDRQKKAVFGDIIMAVTSENIEDVCKCVVWLGSEAVAVSGHTAIIHHEQNPKYLAYYFSSDMFFCAKKRLAQGTKVIEVAPDKLKNIIIPIPPLEIQDTIVDILDKFSGSTGQLIKALGDEAKLRRKQYEYYREQLLSFSDKIQKATIQSVCTIVCSGGTPNSKTSEYYGGNIPWLRTQEIDFGEIQKTELCITEEGLNNSSAKWVPAKTVIVAMYGATVGKVAYTSIPLTTNQACCNLVVDENKAYYKYVFYYLASIYEFIKSLGKGSQTNINAQIVKDLTIPLPSLDEQRRIVSILEKYDSKCKEITDLLMSEIHARKAQYGYYRDKLLSF